MEGNEKNYRGNIRRVRDKIQKGQRGTITLNVKNRGYIKQEEEEEKEGKSDDFADMEREKKKKSLLNLGEEKANVVAWTEKYCADIEENLNVESIE